MPLLFFHIRGVRQELSRDEIGHDFQNVKTAYIETVSAARDTGLKLAGCGWSPRDYIIKVMSAADELVFRITFSDVLDCRTRHLLRHLYQ